MEILNLAVGLVAAVAAALAAVFAWKQLQRDRDARAGQLRCRLLFDDGTPPVRNIRPHLRLFVENVGAYAVRIVRACAVVRRGAGFEFLRPFPAETCPRTVEPGTVAAFAFFVGHPGVQLEQAVWKRLSDEEPFECAFVVVADDRVFFAERVAAAAALKFFHAAGHDA